MFKKQNKSGANTFAPDYRNGSNHPAIINP